MKINKRWVIAVIVLASLSFFFTQVNSVRATFGDVHAVMVLLRVETEILQKTPAGQYYESLFWKYNDELIEITSKYPEHRVEFSRVTRMFVPELEALLDGKGDTVYITPQHIEILKAELAWFESMGSESLRDAIQRELQRFPLDQFIGMTMSEAQDFVNMSWTPNSIFEKLLVPGRMGNGRTTFKMACILSIQAVTIYNSQSPRIILSILSPQQVRPNNGIPAW